MLFFILRDVLYGWCSKCRLNHAGEYKKVAHSQCTYCGGDVEDNYPAAGNIFAMILFPVGLLVCCCIKEKKCVICGKSIY